MDELNINAMNELWERAQNRDISGIWREADMAVSTPPPRSFGFLEAQPRVKSCAVRFIPEI